MTAVTTRVLMPTFNTDPKQLLEAVDSLRAQTDSSWELFIVDDGSTRPDTLNALTDLAADERITIRRQNNSGPAAARNHAARGATSEFLLPLDADDLLSPNFLEATVAALRADPTLVVAYPTTEKFGVESGVIGGDEYSWSEMLRRNLIPVTALTSRSAFEEVGGFDETMRDGLEDHEFFLRLLKTHRSGALKVPEARLRYRIQGGSRNDTVHEDLAKMYRARGRLMAKNGDAYLDHPELIFASELQFREECLRWRQRYGKAEKVKKILKLDKRFPHIG